MSITNQVVRNLLRQKSYCGKIHNVLVYKDGSRGLHSAVLSARRSKSILPDRVVLTAGTKHVFGSKSFKYQTASVFIIRRNESTSSSGNLGAQSSGRDSSESLNVTSGGTSTTASETILSPQSASNLTETLKPSDEVASVASHLVQSTDTSLVFESIPEPPAVPTPVEELVGAVVGEPSMASLGLGGWSPSGIVQQCLEFFHINMGMPWWASILTGTIIVRVLLFPLVVKSQRNAARMQNNMPQLQLLQAKMTEARQTGNALLAAKYGQEMMVFMKEKDISPFKSLLVPVAMAPVFISFFFGLRKMANLPVDSMKEGGLFWFTDLTVPDPLYLLPLITSVTVWITLEIGADGMKLNAQHGQLMKYFMRAIPVIMFPFTLNFPAAILCYWVSTNAISLIQVSVLKIPAVRTKLNIEPMRKITPDMLPIKKKGFKDSLKESWTNMKISKEIEERQRYDEISFKRAGKGPIPKTYKYDPTKVDPLKDAAAAIQAKRK